MITVNQDDNGKTITVKHQDRLQISLPENPTTGFRWKEDQEGPEAGVLSLESVSFLPGAGIGTGGIRQWVFIAEEPGKNSISLRYKRPWESDSLEDKTFRLMVEVLP